MNEFVISSGHALRVRGASGIIDEVDEARKVVTKVSTYLKELGCIVYTFHDDTSKTQRDNINTIVKYHNSKQRKLDISVHFNAASKTNDPRGVEVLYVTQSAMAEKLSKAISDASGLKDRGAKYRDDLGFLNGTNKASILIEVAFVDSSVDTKIYKDKFDEICKAIAETVSGKKLNESKPVVKQASESNKTETVKIETGGLSPENIKLVSTYLIEKGWYAKTTFTGEGNPRLITGGLSKENQKEFESWLNERKWYYRIVD